jgi:hypothetical protein
MKIIPQKKPVAFLKLYPYFFQCHACPALALGGLVAFSSVKIYWVFNTIYSDVKRSITASHRELVSSNSGNEKGCV